MPGLHELSKIDNIALGMVRTLDNLGLSSDDIYKICDHVKELTAISRGEILIGHEALEAINQ